MKSYLTIYAFFIISSISSFSTKAQCPEISKQPISQTDCEGNSIRMLVESNGTNFQWEKKRPNDTDFKAISGATTTNLQIYPTGGLEHPTGTLYRVKVLSKTCEVTSESASITLNSIESILNPLICERSSNSLKAIIPNSIQGNIKSYQWTRSINGGPFQDLIEDDTFAGTNSNELIIKNAPVSIDAQKIKVRIEFQVSGNNDNEGSLLNLNQTATCPRTSNEVSIQIKTSPIPTHSTPLFKGCVNSPISVTSNGCYPYTTFWYNSNGDKIAEGAKYIYTPSDLNSYSFKASCFKNGCESLKSAGTSAQGFNIPAAPQNAGTPLIIKSGTNLTFKASGGTNNIWYLNENDANYISTATSITVKNVINEANDDMFISRWVSQKINECEGPRAKIEVLIPAKLIADAGQNSTLKGNELYSTATFTTAQKGVPPYQYFWTSSAPIDFPNSSNPNIGPFTSSGFIKLTVIDSQNSIAEDITDIIWEKVEPIKVVSPVPAIPAPADSIVNKPVVVEPVVIVNPVPAIPAPTDSVANKPAVVEPVSVINPAPAMPTPVDSVANKPAVSEPIAIVNPVPVIPVPVDSVANKPAIVEPVVIVNPIPAIPAPIDSIVNKPTVVEPVVIVNPAPAIAAPVDSSVANKPAVTEPVVIVNPVPAIPAPVDSVANKPAVVEPVAIVNPVPAIAAPVDSVANKPAVLEPVVINNPIPAIPVPVDSVVNKPTIVEPVVIVNPIPAMPAPMDSVANKPAVVEPVAIVNPVPAIPAPADSVAFKPAIVEPVVVINPAPAIPAPIDSVANKPAIVEPIVIVNPVPVIPAPVDSVANKPAVVEPVVIVNPAPAIPAPIDSVANKPAIVEPIVIVNPAPAIPTPVDSVANKPAVVEPIVIVNPAPAIPAPVDSVVNKPTVVEPVVIIPVPAIPAPIDSVANKPTVVEPVVIVNPVPVIPTPIDSVANKPTVVEPVVIVNPVPVIPTPIDSVANKPAVTEPIAIVNPVPAIPAPVDSVANKPAVIEPVVIVNPIPAIPAPADSVANKPAVVEPVVIVNPVPTIPAPVDSIINKPAITEPIAIVNPAPIVVISTPIFTEPVMIETPAISNPQLPINCEPSIIPITSIDSLTFIDESDITTPVIIDSTIILIDTIEKNCDSSFYRIKISGCTLFKKEPFFKSIQHISGNEFEIIIQADTNLHFQFTCENLKTTSDTIFLTRLKKPEISIVKNFKDIICATSPISIESHCSERINFINWEKDGHSFSRTELISENIENGYYQAVYQDNDCIYRSELVVIDRYPIVQKPIIKVPKNKICKEEKIVLISNDTYPYSEWNNHSNTNTITFQKTNSGTYPIQLRVSDNGICWSDWSDTKYITVIDTPKKPVINQNLIEFTPNDSVQINITETALKYEWTNGRSNQTIYASKEDTIQYRIQNFDGCWSNFSDPIIIRPFNSIKKPSVLNEELNLTNAENNPMIEIKTSIFPNPNHGDFLYLSSNKSLQNSEIIIYDLRGEVVYTKIITENYEKINFENIDLKNGIYLLKIIAKDWSETKRLLIIK